MNDKSNQFLCKNRKLKTKELVKEVKDYIDTSPNGLDLYWFLPYLDLDYVSKVISRLEKSNNLVGIERILQILPYLKKRNHFVAFALKYLRHPNTKFQLPALKFFRITGRKEYLPLFDFLIRENDKDLIEELIETIGCTSPPNSLALLRKIEKTFGNGIAKDYYIRARIEMGILTKNSESK